MESSLLLEIICSPLAEKSMQFTRSVFSLKTFDTRKERNTSSVNFILLFFFFNARARGHVCVGSFKNFNWAGSSFVLSIDVELDVQYLRYLGRPPFENSQNGGGG